MKNNLSFEILKLLMMPRNAILPIKQNNDTVYLNKTDKYYVVAIPFDWQEEILEQFVGLKIITSWINLGEKSLKAICLEIVKKGDINKFSYIISDFIALDNRKKIINNIYAWIDEWKNIFGDSNKKYLVSDVVAELFTLLESFKKDKTFKWAGPVDGTYDIVGEESVIEVKSTITKTNDTIHINSQFQINEKINEYICFVKLEPQTNALSINSLVKDLVKLGYDEDELNESLSKMGYSKGKRLRNVSFNVLSACLYKVTSSNFPTLDIDKLNNLTKSKNIVNFQLTVDLGSKQPFKRIK